MKSTKINWKTLLVYLICMMFVFHWFPQLTVLQYFFIAVCSFYTWEYHASEEWGFLYEEYITSPKKSKNKLEDAFENASDDEDIPW